MFLDDTVSSLGCNLPCFLCCGLTAVDPVAAYEYQRIGYNFNENDIVFPASGNAEGIVDNYNTFGVPGGI